MWEISIFTGKHYSVQKRSLVMSLNIWLTNAINVDILIIIKKVKTLKRQIIACVLELLVLKRDWCVFVHLLQSSRRVFVLCQSPNQTGLQTRQGQVNPHGHAPTNPALAPFQHSKGLIFPFRMFIISSLLKFPISGHA